MSDQAHIDSLLRKLVDEVAARSLTATVSVSIEKMAEEFAKEILLDDPDFKQMLRLMVRDRSRAIVERMLSAPK
jgi:Zn-dependent peptidase ImmA (M78 family)